MNLIPKIAELLDIGIDEVFELTNYFGLFRLHYNGMQTMTEGEWRYTYGIAFQSLIAGNIEIIRRETNETRD